MESRIRDNLEDLAPPIGSEEFDATTLKGWGNLGDETQLLILSVLRLHRMRRYAAQGFPVALVGREKDILAKRCAEVTNLDDIKPLTEAELAEELQG